MELELKIDKNLEKDKLVISVYEINEEITNLINLIKNQELESNLIIGIRDNKKYILELDKIIKFYSLQKKVYAVDVENMEYVVKFYMYELEELLNKNFVRVSNSDIVNLNFVLCLENSFGGNIKLKFKNGGFSYITRSYLKKFKEKIGGKL